eukprot:571141_1
MRGSMTSQSGGEPKWVRFVTGSVASMTAEMCTLPIDISKTRLQLQGSADAVSSVSRPYSGMIDCIVQTGRNEGISGLWKGWPPALIRQGVYSGIRMGLYEPIRDSILSDEQRAGSAHIPFWKMFFSGGLAGGIGSGVATPIDLVKVRFQADVAGTRYKNTLDAFVTIFREEGLRGSFTGAAPAMQRAVLVNAGELASYDYIKRWIVGLGIEVLGEKHHTTHFLASFGAGFCAAVISSPVDVVKTRLMNQKAHQKLYSGVLDCLSRTVRAEGFRALYNGFLPNWLRIGPWSVIMFMTYEQLRLQARGVWEESDCGLDVQC